MAEPFLSEIRIASFDFAPRGWALCDGAILSIAQNQALFALLGTAYGGNGTVTFALPDLRGRVPIHRGTSFMGHSYESYEIGQVGGQEAVTLSLPMIPMHTHLVGASSRLGDESSAVGNRLAATSSNEYGAPAGLTALHPASVRNTGGSQPHSNLQPYLTLTFMIAIQGIFPSRI